MIVWNTIEGEEAIQKVRALKQQLTQTLVQSSLSRDSAGELAAFVALAETTVEFGVLYVGPEVAADLLKKLRRTLMRSGRTAARAVAPN